MRLLERCNGDLRITEDLHDDEIPPYAILSHTWGYRKDEVNFKDMVEGTGRHKAGYKKIQFCDEQASIDGLQYFWVDSCCIDRSSSAELQEAINSMFRWYHRATRCYVYLADVTVTDHYSQWSWEQAFRGSRWFTRGWTLQELLAPRTVAFFSREGRLLGDKDRLEYLVHDITGIAVGALRGSPMSQFEVTERFSWAKSRHTTRGEDEAYSLLGIFGISMPVIYGEGRENAISRLRKEINGASDGNRAKMPQNRFLDEAALRSTKPERKWSAWRTLEHESSILAVAFSPDGNTLATGGFLTPVRLWDSRSGVEMQTLLGHASDIYSLAFSPDGTTLASGSGDSTVRLWDSRSGAALWRIKANMGYVSTTDYVKAVAFSSNDTTLASGGADATVRFWDSRSGAALQTLYGHSDNIESIAFSPNGTTLASGGRDRTVRLWDSRSRATLQILEADPGPCYSIDALAFSPDGTTLAIGGGNDPIVRIWDGRSRAALHTLEGHTGYITALAFSPDGNTLASGGGDSTVRLWDGRSGAMLQMLEGHNRNLGALAFSPDGTTLASGSYDNTVRLWV